MAVQEQTPYIEYTANGITTSFALEFDCDNQDHLIVLVDDVEPVVGAWSFSNGAVVFNAAPENGKKITIQRNTPFSRTTDYQSYNNSFRPPAVNKDFDWIWLKLQELGVADWILSNRIDALKNYVDDRDDELRAYLMEEIRKQGVALDQLEDYYNYLMQRLAEIAVNGGWESSFVSYGPINQKKYNDGVESIAELLAIQNPFQGMRVYVKSFYAGLNAGHGEFVFKAGAAETEIPGFVMNVTGGVWKRVIGSEHSIYDAGGHPTKSATVNTTAINAVLGFLKNALIPNGTFNVLMSSINFVSNSSLIGGVNSVLVGPDPDTQGIADVTGQMFRIDNLNNVLVKQITIKNGYKGKGVWASASNNIVFEDLTIDGFSYGAWIGEDTISSVAKGCIGVKFIRPKVLNTRYWGLYFRCLDVTVDENKTQNISVIDPYFYNANMAAFVCAEGHVKHVTLVNPVFERCNVCMHFESATNYTVVNPTSIDTGKKPDHLPANVEYPFVGWSLYEIFTQNSKVLGGNLDSTVWLGAGSDAKSWNHEYIGLTCKEFVFEGVGEIQDLSKDFFKGYTFSACTTTGALIYQQTDTPLSYLRDFKIVDCSCLLGESGNSGSGSFIGLNPDRSVNWKVINNSFKNSAVRIRCEKTLAFKGNTFDGTDDTQSRLDGVSGVLGSGSFLDFSGNTFQSAGGAVFSDSAILIKNWSVARTDNVVACNGTQRAYRFTDNFRIEFGAGLIYNDTVEKYTDSGTSAFVFLYRA